MYDLYPPSWRGRALAWLAGDPWPQPEPEPEATPPEHRPDPDERQYPDPLQDPHACADCADRLDAVQWTHSTLETGAYTSEHTHDCRRAHSKAPEGCEDPHAAVQVAHAEHTRSGFGVASLCGAPTGYTVPERDSVTCPACKAL